MPSRIVTSTYRYKRPPRKRKAVPLEGPAIVRRGTAKPETPPGKKRVAKADGPLTVRDGSGRAPSGIDTPRSQPPAATPRSAIVTVKLRPGRFGDVPDMTLEENQRRGDAADALFREIVRRATE